MNTNALTTLETNNDLLILTALNKEQALSFARNEVKTLKKAKVGKHITFSNGLTVMKDKTTRDDLKVRTELAFFKNGKKIGMYVLRDFHRV